MTLCMTLLNSKSATCISRGTALRHQLRAQHCATALTGGAVDTVQKQPSMLGLPRVQHPGGKGLGASSTPLQVRLCQIWVPTLAVKPRESLRLLHSMMLLPVRLPCMMSLVCM